MNLFHDALGSCAQGIIETRIKCATPRNRTANANERHHERGCTKNEERDLATGARKKCLDPLASELVAEGHGYFDFGASARRYPTPRTVFRRLWKPASSNFLRR